MGIKNVFERMFLKHLINNVLKHFMCTIYITLHDKCLKNMYSITFNNNVLINVFSENVCI